MTASMQDWSSFWAQATDKHDVFGAKLPSGDLERHWDDFWDAALSEHPAPVIADLACGAGAASRAARRKASPDTAFVYVDISPSAVMMAQAKATRASGVVANCRSVPLNAHSVDILVSQFGLEYAGVEALADAAELVAPGGAYCCVVHHKTGVIAEECAANLAIIKAIEDSDVTLLARRVFRAGFDLRDGRGSLDAFTEADKALSPAVEALKPIVGRSGAASSALQFLRRFYRDLGVMFHRMEAYDETDVLQWLSVMEAEIAAYGGRMRSMLDAALDDGAVTAVQSRLEAAGLLMRPIGSIGERGGRPAAWVLWGRRPSA